MRELTRRLCGCSFGSGGVYVSGGLGGSIDNDQVYFKGCIEFQNAMFGNSPEETPHQLRHRGEQGAREPHQREVLAELTL